MSKIVFIADFFVNHVLGGGELNNDELIVMLQDDGYKVTKIQSHLVSEGYIKKNKNSFFIISNFVNLSFECREVLTKLQYMIYEHDHKYIKMRNPALYKDFKAPSSDIINFHFYKNAKAVLCQSNFHKQIIEKNIKTDNIINLGGNLWSLNILESLREYSKTEKQDRCSVLNSNIQHKNTHGAVKICESRGMKFELVSNSNYKMFLKSLGSNKTFVFIPRTPETLSRVIVEARMMGCSIVTNNLVGATSEAWFDLKGEELINYMIDKRTEILSTIKSLISKSYEKVKFPLISIITTFHEGERFLSNFMTNITQQTIFNKCELIIVDSASKGNEKKIINDFCKKYDNIVHIELEDNLPPTHCLNMAIRRANGEYITFGLIDDVKREDCIELLYNNIVEDESVDLVYGDVLQTAKENQSFDNVSDGDLFEHSNFNFSKENMIKCLPGPMPLWRKRLHERCGFFDTENCNYADDWEMWLRAVDTGSKFKKINEIVGLYLVGGRSQQNDLEQRQEEARIFYKYKHLFGLNFMKFKPYFDQFLRTN